MNLAADTADVCGDICLSHITCTHFTYIWGGCYLKTSSDGSRPQPSGISGTCTKIPLADADIEESTDEESPNSCTSIYGVDYYGADIPGGMNLAADTAEDCSEICLGHSACTHFT